MLSGNTDIFISLGELYHFNVSSVLVSGAFSFAVYVLTLEASHTVVTLMDHLRGNKKYG